MANKYLLNLLKANVEEWNKRRYQPSLLEPYLQSINPRKDDVTDIVANITENDLKKVDLSGADLSRANIPEANLQQANLREANLRKANLRKANLIEAKLNGADISGAFLYEAYLYHADLHGANLNRANFQGADLRGADLRETDLYGVDFDKANLSRANLEGADLSGVDLSGANLREANLKGANLSGANLNGADMSATDLSWANLSGASLINSNLIKTNIANAKISKSNVYGVNIWDLEGEFKEQKDLVVTLENASPITVDNIKVAQFIYLILTNIEIRDVINTLTSKTVLILGRFALPERKVILDTLRDKLREYNLLPIVFDFERPTDKDLTETIKTLAGISYFVIADVTNPKSSPLELQATVPDYQIPFVPIIQEGEMPFAMMANLKTKYGWVLDTISYDSLDTLMEILKPHIIDPAIKKRDELRLIKAMEPTIISGRELLNKKDDV